MMHSIRSLPTPALVGMVQLAPLPGSPGNALPLPRIAELARDDARALAEAGFDAVMIENFGDAPFRSTTVDSHTVACMTVIARAVRETVSLPMGVNVLRNDALAAVAIATVCEAEFVRINVHTGAYATDQGIIEGRAAETLRYRQSLAAHAGPRRTSMPAIFADVHVKHASPLLDQSIGEAAVEAAYRGSADGLVVSGTGTGRPTDLSDLRAVREAVPDRRVFVGSGTTAGNVRSLLSVADGIIIGTAIKRDGVTTRPVDPDRARAFIQAAKG